MALLLKNKTTSVIEIDDLGITVPVTGIYDLRDDNRYSPELDALIAAGSIVFIDDSDPDNHIEMSADDSVKTSKLLGGNYLSFYRKDEIDTLVAPAGHGHHDLYYQKSEIDSTLNGKADTVHNHSDYAVTSHNHNADYAPLDHDHDSSYAPAGHNHDTRYYTEAEVDAKLDLLKFGRNYAYVEELAFSRTLSTDWSTKLTLTISVTEAGYYRIGFNYTWSSNSASQDFISRVVQYNNDRSESTILNEHRQEPKDVSGSFETSGTNQKHPAAGFKHVQLTPGTHHFTIDYTTSLEGVVVSMFDAKLEFWRLE